MNYREKLGLLSAGYILGGPLLTSLGVNLYSNSLQRDYYNYQKSAYERQLADWHKNVPGREIKYPELSYEGQVKRLDLGINQSYLSNIRDLSNFNRSAGFAIAGGLRSPYVRSGSLYGRSTGLSARYL